MFIMGKRFFFLRVECTVIMEEVLQLLSGEVKDRQHKVTGFGF